jgi:hypothetical protein
VLAWVNARFSAVGEALEGLDPSFNHVRYRPASCSFSGLLTCRCALRAEILMLLPSTSPQTSLHTLLSLLVSLHPFARLVVLFVLLLSFCFCSDADRRDAQLQQRATQLEAKRAAKQAKKAEKAEAATKQAQRRHDQRRVPALPPSQQATPSSSQLGSVSAASFYNSSAASSSSPSVTRRRQLDREQDKAASESKRADMNQYRANLSAAQKALAADAKGRSDQQGKQGRSRHEERHHVSAKASSNKSSAQAKAADQRRELLSPEQAAAIDAAGPTPISAARKGEIYKELAHCQSAERMGQRACACCMKYAYNDASQERAVDGLPGSSLLKNMRARLVDVEGEHRLHREVADDYNALSVDQAAATADLRENVFKELRGLLLYPPGLRVDQKGRGFIVLCDSCMTSLQDNRRKKAPRFAISSGCAVGPQPACIKEATRTEIEMTSFVSLRAVVNVIYPSGRPSSAKERDDCTRRQLSSHTISYSSEPGPAAQALFEVVPACSRAT